MRVLRAVVIALGMLWALLRPEPVYAQLGALISPGRLAAAHASLEGLSNCTKCHEQGRKVSVAKCLSCHAPIATRVANKTGVHRDAGTDCVRCHADHAGVNGQLRPFDQRGFDHATNTAFPLSGRHAPLALQCAACHKTPSFLTASPTCVSCHVDVHRPSLGKACDTCHTVDARFQAARTSFDHTRASFALTGAHAKVACANCHQSGAFKGVAFGACTDCHKDPHRSTLGTSCTTCHSTSAWATSRITHTATAYPLEGRHTTVACSACHVQPPMKARVAFATCASCHRDPHNGAFAQDCGTCHTVKGFKGAPFDHTKTSFALTGGHAPVACVACHRQSPARSGALVATTSFKGLSSTCVSCHADVHAGSLSTTCDTCHSTATFKVGRFTHRTASPFFGGVHEAVACAQCHAPTPLTKPVGTRAPVSVANYTSASRQCATCHTDTHLGQVGNDCERCHSLDRPAFAVTSFDHARTTYPLTGRHTATSCERCHAKVTAAFPSGRGTAVKFTGLATTCVSCHADVHLGQLQDRCETCHTTRTFSLTQYQHRGDVARLFTGAHAKATCADCHKKETRTFPTGHGTATRFAVGSTCVSCHTDIHRGALGRDCASCHRP